MSICLNTDYTVSLIDWDFLKKHTSDTKVKKMTWLIKIQELDFNSHAAEDYVKLNLYLSANHGKTADIHWEIHIINNLKVNILIEIDILISEQIDVLLSQWKVIIESCKKVQLNLNVTTLSNQINQLLLLNNQTIILVYEFIIVQVKSLHVLLTDWDLLFKSNCKLVNIYAYISIVDHSLISIEVWNNFSKAVIISHHTSLDYIIEYKVNRYFLVSSDLLP